MKKIKKISFILLCIFIVLFPFWCVRGLCAEQETVDLTVVNDVQLSANRNYFVTSSNNYVSYFEVEQGYIYHITKIGGTYPSPLVSSSEVPANNVTYDIITNIETGQSYDFIANSDTFIILSTTSNSYGNTFEVTREKLGSYDGAVSGLVDNIGLDNVWSIFDNSINFIYIAIIFAFGFGLVTLLIKKISKGSE